MSEASPFTFHQVGAPGEPQHWELRDLSGRVVCKALLSESVAVLHTVGRELGVIYFTRRYTVVDLEASMRIAVRG